MELKLKYRNKTMRKNVEELIQKYDGDIEKIAYDAVKHSWIERWAENAEEKLTKKVNSLCEFNMSCFKQVVRELGFPLTKLRVTYKYCNCFKQPCRDRDKNEAFDCEFGVCEIKKEFCEAYSDMTVSIPFYTYSIWDTQEDYNKAFKNFNGINYNLDIEKYMVTEIFDETNGRVIYSVDKQE